VTNKAYISDITVRNISDSFAHKMVAKTSWHRCGTKRRRGHPMYTPKYDFSRRLNVSSDTPMSRSVAGRLFHTVSL